jgi:hypothetical protein
VTDGHEPWFEKLIRDATDAGEFDDLAGAGRPIDDLDRPYDPAWWARRWMVRETVAEEARTLAATVRREIPRILAGTDESAIVVALDRLNGEIIAVNARLAEADRLPTLDVTLLIVDRASRRSDS